MLTSINEDLEALLKCVPSSQELHPECTNSPWRPAKRSRTVPDLGLSTLRTFAYRWLGSQEDSIALAQWYVLLEDILYRVDPHLKSSKNSCPQVSPRRSHGTLPRWSFGGHFSGDCLLKTLKRQWWWKDMYKDCVHHARNCPNCSFVAGGEKLGKPPLQPIFVPCPCIPIFWNSCDGFQEQPRWIIMHWFSACYAWSKNW